MAELTYKDLTPASRRALRRLELAVSRPLDGVLHGDFQSIYTGTGFEPGETRRYVPGDDVRLIDWNVTARTTEAHVRDPVRDHDLDVWLLADMSASQDFGTVRCEKRALVVAAAAAFGIPAVRCGNRVGTVVARPEGLVTSPLRASRERFLAVLHQLHETPCPDGAGAVELTPALGHLDRLARRRSLLVVISDFLVPDDWVERLKVMATRHDVVAVEVIDPRELELPDVGVVTLQDPETGRTRTVDTHDHGLRERFARTAEAHRASVAHSLRRCRIDHLVLRTDREWLPPIVQFFAWRQRRRPAVSRPEHGLVRS